MDISHYKDIVVSGLNYHYYYRAASVPSNPTLLFLHGFPSTSEHWIHQATYFSGKGYGVVALDMLGYGGTSKPEDPKAYDGNNLAAHCVAILDAENIVKAVVISHDWGTRVGSRLANLYPERHLASVFLSVSYLPPNPSLTMDAIIEGAKAVFKRDIFSYWKFFSAEEAPQLMAAHDDSFYSIAFAADTDFWENFCPDGELKKWLLADRMAPVASWAPSRERHHKTFRAGGWIAPTNWYRSVAHGVTCEGDKAVPKDCYKVTFPVLQVTTLRDPICTPERAIPVAKAWCSNLTVRQIDSGHWVMFEKPDELNIVIEDFVLGLKVG